MTILPGLYNVSPVSFLMSKEKGKGKKKSGKTVVRTRRLENSYNLAMSSFPGLVQWSFAIFIPQIRVGSMAQ